MNEFVDWYTSGLGFSRVYMVIDPPEIPLMRAAIHSSLLGKCAFLPCPLPKAQQNSVGKYMPQLISRHVRETWTLHVDSDELLMLTRPGMKIQQFCPPPPVNHVVFSWITVSCNLPYAPSMTALLHDPRTAIAKSLGSARKTMAITKHIRALNWHTMTVSNSKTVTFAPDPTKYPVVVHFNVRSQTHTVLKALEQTMGNRKSATGDRDGFVQRVLLHEDPRNLSTHDRLVACAPRMIVHLSEVICGASHNIWRSEFAARMPVSAYRADESRLCEGFVLTTGLGKCGDPCVALAHRNLGIFLEVDGPLRALFLSPYEPPTLRLGAMGRLLSDASQSSRPLSPTLQPSALPGPCAGQQTEGVEGKLESEEDGGEDEEPIEVTVASAGHGPQDEQQHEIDAQPEFATGRAADEHILESDDHQDEEEHVAVGGRLLGGERADRVGDHECQYGRLDEEQCHELHNAVPGHPDRAAAGEPEHGEPCTSADH